MMDIQILIMGFVGGLLSASAISMVFLAQIKSMYDEKFSAINIQLASIRSELNVEYRND